MSFNTKLRFIVTSDIHYKADVDTEKERFEKGMLMAYEYAKKQSYKEIDAFFAVGDFANKGSESEMLKFKQSLDKVIDKNTKITLMLASHEFMTDGEEGALSRFKSIFNQEPDNYFELKGCPFICLSTENGCRIKEGKQKWLKDCLNNASEKEKNRPFFVFQHPHLTDTVYGSICWGDDDIITILTDYPQVVDFSGHSHAPINDPRSVCQKFFTSFGTGSFSYFELDEFDNIYKTLPPNKNMCAQFYIVEVSDKNSVRVIPVDVISGNFFNDGLLIETPWEPESFVYTPDRALNESKPYFDKIDITYKKDADMLTLVIPQAKTDDYRVNSYTVILRDKLTGEVVGQKKISSSYYIYDMPEYVELTFEFPYDKGSFIADIYANGFWYIKSEKLVFEFSI